MSLKSKQRESDVWFKLFPSVFHFHVKSFSLVKMSLSLLDYNGNERNLKNRLIQLLPSQAIYTIHLWNVFYQIPSWNSLQLMILTSRYHRFANDWFIDTNVYDQSSQYGPQKCPADRPLYELICYTNSFLTPFPFWEKLTCPHLILPWLLPLHMDFLLIIELGVPFSDALKFNLCKDLCTISALGLTHS